MENANELLLILEMFKESDEIDTDKDDIDSSREWFNMINRGGAQMIFTISFVMWSSLLKQCSHPIYVWLMCHSAYRL